MKKVIAIIFGGQSDEYDISLSSAMNVVEHIDHDTYDILQVGINKDGRMFAGPNVLLSLKHKRDLDKLTACTISTNKEHPGVFILTKSGQHVFQKVDLFFPLTHGPKGEDGTLQGVLEYSGVPYVGSNVLGSALGMDKIVMKKIFATYRLPQVPFLPFTKKQITDDIISVKEEILANLSYPLFVKPANLGSSIGVKKVKTSGKLEDALLYACKYSDRIIVEQGIKNMREMECAILESDQLDASTVGEVISSREFYDYKAKYNDDSTQMIVPALTDKVTISTIQSMAKKAFTILHLRGLARVDFFVTAKDVFINEVNTIPGFTPTSMYTRLFAASGKDIHALIQEIVSHALTT